MKTKTFIKEENNKILYCIDCKKCGKIISSLLKNQIKKDYELHRLNCK